MDGLSQSSTSSSSTALNDHNLEIDDTNGHGKSSEAHKTKGQAESEPTTSTRVQNTRPAPPAIPTLFRNITPPITIISPLPPPSQKPDETKTEHYDSPKNPNPQPSSSSPTLPLPQDTPTVSDLRHSPNQTAPQPPESLSPPASPAFLSPRASGSTLQPPTFQLHKRPKTSSSSTTAKASSFSDASGNDVPDVVAERTKTRSARKLSATSIFTIYDYVQIFYIGADGAVQAPEDTSPLNLVRLIRASGPTPATPRNTCTDENFFSDDPEFGQRSFELAAFLHVGTWLYPLIPGCSPVLITAFGTYVFPDLRSDREGSAVALVLPQFVTSDEREKFEVLLDYYGFVEDTVDRLKDDRWQPSSRSSISGFWEFEENVTRVSRPINSMSTTMTVFISVLTSIVVIAITLLTRFGEWIIRSGASALRAQAARASMTLDVDPHVLRGVLYAKSATDKTVVVTAYIVENLQESAMNLSRRIAPRPSILLPGFLQSKDNVLGQMLHLTAVVGVSAYGGVGDVYKSLGDAANTLFEVLSEEAVKTMEHKYGDNYGNLTREAFDAARNVKNAVRDAHTIATLAFVPNTIEKRVKEKLDTEDGSDEEVDFLEEGAKRMKKLERKGTEPRTESKMSRVGSSAKAVSSSAVDISPPSTPHPKKFWGGLSSTTLDSTSLQAKAVRRDSSTSALWTPSRSSKDSAKNTDSMTGTARKTDSVTSNTKATDSTTGVNNEPGRFSQFSPSSSTSAVPSYRGSTQGSIRRQSIFLSHRRQSMHVFYAMAAAVDKQFVSGGASTALLAARSAERRRDKFHAAAVSISRAKIRRRHREYATEKLLVVVVTASRLLAAQGGAGTSQSAPGI